ncbi:MAG: hypothetical protein IT292_12375 [Deltaproteobacteria bacterium]|nr:hypothetical protein [Deltaproteobacteria bacterium]
MKMMLAKIKKANKVLSDFSIKHHTQVSNYMYHNRSKIILAQGCLLLAIGLVNIAQADAGLGGAGGSAGFDDKYIKDAICKVMDVIEGAFGALLMTVAGLGAIVSAAIGAYKSAMNCMIVALGSWVIRSFVTLYFGKEVFGDSCKSGRSVKTPNI